MKGILPRQPLIGVALSAMAGIALGDAVAIGWGWLLGFWAIVTVMTLFVRRTSLCWLVIGSGFWVLHVLACEEGLGPRLARELELSSQVGTVRGWVWTQPAVGQKTLQFVLLVEKMEMESGWKRDGPGLLQVYWSGEGPKLGDRVKIRGTVRNVGKPRNPGQFDWAGELKRQGIYSEMESRFAADCVVVDGGGGLWWARLAERARAWARRAIETGLEDDPQTAGLIESMVLGIQGEQLAELKDLFQRTGTLHLFAVSGLNVAMVATLFRILLRPLRIPRVGAVLLIMLLLWLYAGLTGLGASCLRATVMGMLVLGGQLCDRPSALFNSLGASALLLLAWDTNELYRPGFQFSFLLVLAVVLLARPIEAWIESKGGMDPFLPRKLWTLGQHLTDWLWKGFAATAGVTLAAWLGSLPLSIGYFHLISPAALPANLLVVPLAFVMLGLGVLSMLGAVLGPTIPTLLNNANWLIAKILVAVVGTVARIPAGQFYVEWPRWSVAPIYEIECLDLGSGGSAHLRLDGHDWLFDCGNPQQFTRIVLPYLRSRGVNGLEGLILSHGDVEHLGGAPSVVEVLRPARIIMTAVTDRSRVRRAFHAGLANEQTGVGYYFRGDVLEFTGQSRFRVLYPPMGLQRGLADDKALVLLLEAEGFRVLLMSDSGFLTEQWLLEHEPGLRADLVLKGQHQKDLSGTMEFLQRLQPKAVICGAARFGSAAQNLAEWEREVRGLGIAVFRQDQTGAVQITLQSKRLLIRSFLGNQIFRMIAE